jgi:hypothetical protein
MNKLRLLLVLLFGIFLFMGCNKWTEPEFNAGEWVPPTGTQTTQFWTINSRNVLGKHPLGTSPDSLTDYRDTRYRYIRAVVVSSDEGGNYYKSMVVQDSTAGVELELDMTGLYNTYPVGQKIVIVCNGLDMKGNGLVIGDYNNLPQIGWIYNETQVGRVNALFLDNYIIKDGLPSLKNLPKPLTNNEIDFFGHRDINKLVRLENVTFDDKAIGKPIAYNDFTTDWVINVPLANGTKPVTVRTSNYAKFRSTTIQKGEYNLTGILTIYRDTTYQFMIRTKEDIELIPVQPDESLAFDFATNPLEDGWSTQSVSGNSTWAYRPASQLMLHLGNSQTTFDDWLISPVINYPDWANGYLTFEHQLPVPNAEVAAYQIYYTTSNLNSNIFNIDDWKPLGTLNSFPAQFDWSNRFPLSSINANNFRIAFRYNAQNPNVETFEWRIRKVAIRNK